MKNKIALFFLVIAISITSLSICENLKNETNNNKISKQILDEKNLQIKKEGNGWSSWSTKDKIVAVSLATVCIVAVIIGGIIWRIDGNSSNNESSLTTSQIKELRNLGTKLDEQIKPYSNHLDTLDELIKKHDTPPTS